MDKLLRPDRFQIEPNDPNAEKLYKHWKLTFNNYVEATTTTTSRGESSVTPRGKLFALINNISANVFDIISEAESFEDAINALDRSFIKPSNIVYNRHTLITCKQQPSQSIDTYTQENERIAKTCNFEAVSAEQKKQQYIRDAFINGIISPSIRQRLLESSTLTLTEAYNQARSLEQAQKQSASYENHLVAALHSNNIDENSIAATTSCRNHNKSDEVCYFCGNLRHPHVSCPARNSDCGKCKKKGHWAKVCKSTLAAISNTENNPSLA